VKPIHLLAAGAWCCVCAVGAIAQINVETVVVGNPGNAGEKSGKGAGGMGEDRVCGAVKYTYEMGKFEITAEQYTEFLNAVAATDTCGLYNPQMTSHAEGCKIERTGSAGSYKYTVAEEWAKRPVNFVSWADAARFANWLHNGQPTGPQDKTTTENGSYALNGAKDDAALLALKRRRKATWVIPTEDEWYKAAFHRNDGVTGHYWDYATSSNTLPGSKLISPDPGNSANFDPDGQGKDVTVGPPYFRTPVGAFKNSPSPYGTFDQGGNVWEWIEAIHRQQGQVRRGVRGASYTTLSQHMQAADRHFALEPLTEHHLVGFRLARVEPRRPAPTSRRSESPH
jgi:formylglycine-generating enzyme required for sulfatase activity